MKSPRAGSLSTLGWRLLREEMDSRINEGGDTERQWDKEKDGKVRRKKDESVDKVKLEMRPTDGGAKNVTCQVAGVTPGMDGQINRQLQSGR